MVYSVLETIAGDRLVIAKERLAAVSETLGLACEELFTIEGNSLFTSGKTYL